VPIRTIAAPDVLDDLMRRLEDLTSASTRRWGTLTAHEMLCHLGDATAMVLLDRPRVVPIAGGRRPVRKTLGLWSPLRWPHGLRTSPHYNPHTLGTRPTAFDRDRDRVIDGLRRLAVADPTLPLEPAHGFFGTMSTRAWQRWAFKHTEHHLRQFGL
jgi:DinB family protein